MESKRIDVRWKQRLQNFERAFNLLERTLQIDGPSEAERGGLIQFYEMAFELAWRLMKDYLSEEGYTLNSPREAVKQAFQSGVIAEGHRWIEALDDRNLTSHTYDENTAQKVVTAIRTAYFPILREFYATMKKKAAQ
jgi:nucleotidyltransferase substrate binding protein (TIGR01987 family)